MSRKSFHVEIEIFILYTPRTEEMVERQLKRAVVGKRTTGSISSFGWGA